jgi:D-sedoheptulose 7-phosphate isomerase
MGVGRLRTIPDGWRVLRTIWSERRREAARVGEGVAHGTTEWLPHTLHPALETAGANGSEEVAGHPNNGRHPATNGNGNGYHANGNGNGNGKAYDTTAFVELGVVADAHPDYAAYPIASEEFTPGDPATWTGLTETYLARLNELLGRVDRADLVNFVEELRAARDRGATIFFAGNGGSSATAAHWVNDLGKATKAAGRAPMRVMNLTDNVPWLTALGNDEGIARVFSGQLENFARPNDLVVVISASGNSPNILDLLTTARAMGVRTAGLVGFDGGRALSLLDTGLWVETEAGAYGLVETAHTALADIVTTCLVNDRVPVVAKG